MVPFGQMATGRKRPVEEDLLSENHDAKNLKLRAHVGGIALNMLASCSSPWIQYDSAFRNQCMPGGMVPQYLGAGGAASLPLLMGCDSLQQCAAGMRAGHSLGVSSCDSSHRLSVDVQMQQQGSNRPGMSMMNHQLQSSMQVSTGSNPGGGFVPLGITQIRLLQGLAAAAASKNFVPADHSSAFVSPSISKPRKSGASYNKYCHFCQHVKVKRVDSMFACRNKHCSRRFCEHCLKVHLACLTAEDAGALSPTDENWSCPVCRKTCCCSISDCSQDHRHCKAYRYRRRRAEVKRPYDDGEGPVLVSNEDVASPVGPQVSPKTESRGAEEILSNKGSIRELLDSKADTNVWLTPSFWSHPKWYSSAGMPDSATESSGLCSPAPSEVPSAYSPHLASGPRNE